MGCRPVAVVPVVSVFNNNNNNNNNKFLTANGLSPGGSGYNACTCIWNKDLRNLSREGYMRSMQ